MVHSRSTSSLAGPYVTTVPWRVIASCVRATWFHIRTVARTVFRRPRAPCMRTSRSPSSLTSRSSRDEVHRVTLGGGDQQVEPAVTVDVADTDDVEPEVLALGGRGDRAQHVARAARAHVDPSCARRAVTGGVGADREVDPPVVVDVAGLAARPGAVERPTGPAVEERPVAAGVHAHEPVAVLRVVVAHVEVRHEVTVDAPDAGDEELPEARRAERRAEGEQLAGSGEHVRTAGAPLGPRADDQPVPARPGGGRAGPRARGA